MKSESLLSDPRNQQYLAAYSVGELYQSIEYLKLSIEKNHMPWMNPIWSLSIQLFSRELGDRTSNNLQLDLFDTKA